MKSKRDNRDDVRTARGHARWAVPLALIVAWFMAAVFLRAMMVGSGENCIATWRPSGESELLEICQSIMLGAALLLCISALTRSGPRRAEFYWWVVPGFICLFMFWREIEFEDHFIDAHAFSWKYLFDDELPLAGRLLLGIPTLTLSLTVLVVCLRHVRLLLTTIRRRDLRIGTLLFLAGLGFYLVAQVYDRAYGLATEHGIMLPGFLGHRDDFWEEATELAGAMAVLLGVIDHFIRRPIVAGTLAEALPVPAAVPAAEPVGAAVAAMTAARPADSPDDEPTTAPS